MKKFVLSKEEFAPSDYSIEYENVLNPAQYDAVMHDSGPALIVAGAGTGKTRTLVYRLARLVESGGDPSQILLLTFTRRAASEKIGRASCRERVSLEEVTNATARTGGRITQG